MLQENVHSPSNEFSHGVFLPGPLEGGEEARESLPADVGERLRAQLNADHVDPVAFGVLGIAAVFLRVEAREAEVVAASLRRSRYQLYCVEDEAQLFLYSRGSLC